MRSSSEVRFGRVTNEVNGRTVKSRWHALIAGHGDPDVWPGLVCSTRLVGSLQVAPYSARETLDGPVHDVCLAMADDWVASLSQAPAPLVIPDQTDVPVTARE